VHACVCMHVCVRVCMRVYACVRVFMCWCTSVRVQLKEGVDGMEVLQSG